LAEVILEQGLMQLGEKERKAGAREGVLPVSSSDAALAEVATLPHLAGGVKGRK
jgi:hypothetical protein